MSLAFMLLAYAIALCGLIAVVAGVPSDLLIPPMFLGVCLLWGDMLMRMSKEKR